MNVIALVGRPNVGKSTLFNQLTRTRDALVADFPGLTRDRQYGIGRVGGFPYLVIDTGGLVGEGGDGLQALMERQTHLAIDEAGAVVFIVDAREGLTAGDEAIAAELRRTGKPVVLALTQTDGLDAAQAAAEFHVLGLGDPVPISAAHGRGLEDLLTAVRSRLPETAEDETPAARAPGIRIAFVGRPNAGKSTLVNRILGEERVIVSEIAGTTRDSIEVPFVRDGEPWVLIDTAGIRRRARVHEVVEKFSVVKALAAIEAADVVVYVIDAREGVTEQDAHLLGLVVETGRALVIAINKWDGLDQEQRERVRREIDLRLSFLDFAEMRFVSALHGTGVGELFPLVRRAHESASIKMSTPELTRLVEEAVRSHPPPATLGRRVKLRYAHQGGNNPPLVIVHGSQTEKLPFSWRRYLANFLRARLKLVGTPLKLEFRTGANPYAGRARAGTRRRRGN